MAKSPYNLKPAKTLGSTAGDVFKSIGTSIASAVHARSEVTKYKAGIEAVAAEQDKDRKAKAASEYLDRLFTASEGERTREHETATADQLAEIAAKAHERGDSVDIDAANRTFKTTPHPAASHVQFGPVADGTHLPPELRATYKRAGTAAKAAIDKAHGF